MTRTFGILQFLSRELTVVLISILPGVELRGALPLGMTLGMTPTEAFLISYCGSLIPVVPVVLLIRPLVMACARFRYLRRFGQWLVRRTMKRSGQVQKYQALGLFLFVAVPLPGTGVWTGAMLAGLLGLRLRVALLSIAAGNLVAGLLIAWLSHQLL